MGIQLLGWEVEIQIYSNIWIIYSGKFEISQLLDKSQFLITTQKYGNSYKYKKMTSHEMGQIPQQNIIAELREQPNFLAVRYNEEHKPAAATESKKVTTGGVYIPPHKLRAMQKKIMEEDPSSLDHQKMMWQLLRKSINGIVNKVNISNIQNIVIQLFNQNLQRVIGLLTRAIIKAQMTSPNFTHVYAALISVINSKLPQIGNLLSNRVMIMFNRSFKRNNKIVCIATTKMIAHLVNQRVLGEFVALQLLMILLMHPTQDSVQIACDFMMEVGQVLGEISPAAVSAIFQRFKNLLHEGEIGQKAQYSIEKLFAVRKTGFKNHPGVIPELDLVESEDQITHNLDFQQQLNGAQHLNRFKQDKNFLQTEEEWDKVKLQILGQQNILNLKQSLAYNEHLEQQQYYNQPEQQQGIKDLTQQDLINLRRTIYLAIQSTVNFEQCAHKILKMNIAKGYQSQLIDMILQCCMMERIYQDFFGLLASRFCEIDDMYKELLVAGFVNYYNTVFKLEVNKIRNLAKLYAHLFYTHSIDWKIMQVITLKQDSTTSAHRMFLKILFRQIAQNLGLQKLQKQFNQPDTKQYFSGLFPIGHPNDLRFAINYWTSIGLGPLTQDMREVLAMQEEIIAQRKNKEEMMKIQQLMREEQEMLEAEEQERAREEQQELLRQEQLKKIKQQELELLKREQEHRREQTRKKQERDEKERKERKERQEREKKMQAERKQREKSKIAKNQRKKRVQSSSSESSSSSSLSISQDSSSSISDETPKVNKKRLAPQKDQQKKKQTEKNQKKKSASVSNEQSQSSGISSSDSDDESKPQKEKKIMEKSQKYHQKQPVKKGSDSSSSSSLSMSSSNSSDESSSPIRRRKASTSNERSRKKPQNRRKRSLSSSSSSQIHQRRRNKSPPRPAKKR